jgi:hypothetical protein
MSLKRCFLKVFFAMAVLISFMEGLHAKESSTFFSMEVAGLAGHSMAQADETVSMLDVGLIQNSTHDFMVDALDVSGKIGMDKLLDGSNYIMKNKIADLAFTGLWSLYINKIKFKQTAVRSFQLVTNPPVLRASLVGKEPRMNYELPSMFLFLLSVSFTVLVSFGLLRKAPEITSNSLRNCGMVQKQGF